MTEILEFKIVITMKPTRHQNLTFPAWCNLQILIRMLFCVKHVRWGLQQSGAITSDSLKTHHHGHDHHQHHHGHALIVLMHIWWWVVSGMWGRMWGSWRQCLVWYRTLHCVVNCLLIRADQSCYSLVLWSGRGSSQQQSAVLWSIDWTNSWLNPWISSVHCIDQSRASGGVPWTMCSVVTTCSATALTTLSV